MVYMYTHIHRAGAVTMFVRVNSPGRSSRALDQKQQCLRLRTLGATSAVPFVHSATRPLEVVYTHSHQVSCVFASKIHLFGGTLSTLSSQVPEIRIKSTRGSLWSVLVLLHKLGIDHAFTVHLARQITLAHHRMEVQYR